MKTRIVHIWQTLTSGYWFVPSVMTLAASVLAVASVHLDETLVAQKLKWNWTYGGGSAGARTMLSAIAGSVITVAGVVFSITVAALTQASSQFGPRLLRNFMRDTSNQIVLGTFVSTFMYCLLVLRTVRGETDATFVPQASVTLAVAMAAASIAVLIYFIHHVSLTLQAPNVIAQVAEELADAIDRLPRSQTSHNLRAPDAGLPDNFEENCVIVRAPKDGYVDAVDIDSLIELACKNGLVLRSECRAGTYCVEMIPLVTVWPGSKWDDEFEKPIQRAFIIGSQRTSEQDLEYSVRQIVEVAVRALSPGINDPFTAMNGLDALGAGLCRAARQGLPDSRHYDDEDNLRLMMPVTTFKGLADAAFNQIRQYGGASVAVVVRLLEVLTTCGGQCDATERAVLLTHAEKTWQQVDKLLVVTADRDDVRERYTAAVEALKPVEALTDVNQ